MKHRSLKKHIGCLAITSWLGLVSHVQAQTVDWGTDATLTGNAARLSDGSAMTNAVTWSLGYFANGFVPDATNYLGWAANYVSVGTTAWQDDGTGIWSVPGHVDDVGAAAAGNQVYTFAFNNLSLLGTSSGEALLYRLDGQTFPTIPNFINAQLPDNPFDPNDDAFSVIWGTVDRNIYGAGGLIVGGGLVTSAGADSVAGEFTAQTATWAAVPEPATGLLGALGCLALFRRKRPSAKQLPA